MARRESGAPAGSTAMLVLSLLKGEEMYGYQIIEELERRSQAVFRLKEGTLYPLLHGMEQEGLVAAREAQSPAGRPRRYYRITGEGLKVLEEKRTEWHAYAHAVSAVLAWG